MCVCVYLGIEALCILCDAVQLGEAQHVLLTARPVEDTQSEGRERREDLQNTHTRTHTHKLRFQTRIVPVWVVRRSA